MLASNTKVSSSVAQDDSFSSVRAVTGTLRIGLLIEADPVTGGATTRRRRIHPNAPQWLKQGSEFSVPRQPCVMIRAALYVGHRAASLKATRNA